ncbi:a6cdd0a2-9155-49dc-80a9-4257a0f8baa2 [Thermothielavioides terrestris]|uniref:A6cdd0a2-9155-49dc-80a9-4257a0f8baa2 n=1 Tax=Thermothielavioides terrestris TaxID=2587410 RepID=A0A446B7R5_9PEZI|nr:a6cdd0a2-9155-49dc-80a9-4257a0f8baa2 [Thermothielavioides terrestris]
MTVAMLTAHPSAPPPPPPLPTPPTPATTTTTTTTTTTIATTTTTTKTTLGGVLPANVDPRQAAEQIRREAWQRCRAEARAMSQRRMLLLGRERGALRRETQRLQANLDRMREAARRGGRGRSEDEGGGEGEGGEDG